MNRIRMLLVFGLLAASCQLPMTVTCQADENVAGQPKAGDAPISAARRVATERRREWLRKHLTAELRDADQLARVNAQLDALDDQQVDVAAARMLEQLDKRQRRGNLNRAVAELERAREAREALREKVAARYADRYGATPPPAGFFPVITVLPEGASLTASAVVSPDRRHVRINVNPFFSSVGPVDTFNFYTGETRRPPEFNPQLRQPPPVVPRYDGLRNGTDRLP